MKIRKMFSMVLTVCILSSMLAIPSMAITVSLASDLEYYDSDGHFGVFNTSTTTTDPISTVGVVATTDRVDKNTAVEPPPYGIFGGYIATDYVSPYYDNYATTGTVVSNGTSTTLPDSSWLSGYADYSALAAVQTEVKYLADGSIGTMTIPALNITNTKIYEGATESNMAKGLGHFEDTSAWDGNVCFAGHNRGSSPVIIGGIKDMVAGDTITYTTSYGTRTYSVVSVSKVSYTDTSCLTQSYDKNRLTLVTCVMNEPNYRWVLVAEEVK